MPKMTKAQARKRLSEARNKMIAVVIENPHHLTPADEKKLYTLSLELLKIINKLK